MRRKYDRLCPLEAVFLVGRRCANGIDGPWRHVLSFFRAMVIARDLAAIRTGIDNLGIARIRRNVAALTSAYGVPACAVNTARRCAGNRHRRVVLLRSIEVIRETVVSDHVIELRRRLVPLIRPTCAAVGAYVGSAVIRFNHAVRIIGINPQAMIVAVRHANRAKSFSAVVGAIHSRVQHINAVGVAWIGKNMRVIKRALPILAIAIRQRPCIAAIIGAEQAAFIRFHQRPNAIAAISHSQADASQRSIRQSMAGELLPRCAAIGAAIQSAARARRCPCPRACASPATMKQKSHSGSLDPSRDRCRRSFRPYRGLWSSSCRRPSCDRCRVPGSRQTHAPAPPRRQCQDSSDLPQCAQLSRVSFSPLYVQVLPASTDL